MWSIGLLQDTGSHAHRLAADIVRSSFFEQEHLRALMQRLILLKQGLIDLRMAFEYMRDEYVAAQRMLTAASMRLVYNRAVFELREQFAGNRETLIEVARRNDDFLADSPGLQQECR